VAEPAREVARDREGASQPPSQKSTVREYAEAFGIALVLAIIIRTFIGDHILVNKLIYGLRMPDSLFGFTFPGVPWGHYVFELEPVHRGDVVVFVFPPDPTKDFIKRVIAVGGDTIAVKNGTVFLNGKVMPDPHAHLEVRPEDRSPLTPRDNFGPVTVPQGKLFMMGDNRDRSYDSRFWGFVDRNEVEGRAILIYWSWDSEGTGILPLRWGRFGKIIY
jgi:signal peptidase I